MDVKQFSLNVNVVDCDYAKTHENCNEELLSQITQYPTINYQHQLLRDKNDTGEPWKTVQEYNEHVFFDKAMQCFGIEKWERKEDDNWIFKRSLLGHRFYPKIYGAGDNKYELNVNSVAMNAVVTFLPYFQDAFGGELEIDYRYVMHLPFYPCRYESTNSHMHDYEKIFFNKTESTGKLAVSIQRGKHRLYSHHNIYDVMIRQNGTRDIFTPYGGEVLTYIDSDYFFRFASSDIYDIEGKLAKSGDDDDYETSVRGRLNRHNNLSLRATGENGLFETFYQEYAKFIANQVPAVVTDNATELNKVPLHEKVNINNQDFVITKRKHVLTLHAHKICSTELAAVVL